MSTRTLTLPADVRRGAEGGGGGHPSLFPPASNQTCPGPASHRWHTAARSPSMPSIPGHALAPQQPFWVCHCQVDCGGGLQWQCWGRPHLVSGCMKQSGHLGIVFTSPPRDLPSLASLYLSRTGHFFAQSCNSTAQIHQHSQVSLPNV